MNDLILRYEEIESMLLEKINNSGNVVIKDYKVLAVIDEFTYMDSGVMYSTKE